MQPPPDGTPDPSPHEPDPPEAAASGPADGGNGAPFPYEPVPPNLLAWARQTFDVQEYRAGLREIEATGGRSFEELIAEVEARVRGS